jgi:uncharacterized protein YoxC
MLVYGIGVAVLFLLLLIGSFYALSALAKKIELLNSTQQQLDDKISQYQDIVQAIEQTTSRHYKYASETQKKVDTIQTEVKEHKDILLNLPSLIEQISQIQNQVQLMQSQQSDQTLYGRAKKMVEMGADVEELMSECDMPRGEAELLISMHKK